MKRFVVILLLVACLGGAVYWAWWQRSHHKEQGPPTLYGNIEIRDSELAFNNQQKVERVLVDEGDRVKAGQLLAQLDTTRLAAQVAANEAALAAQEQVVRRLVNGSRPEEIDQAKANVRVMEVRLANAQRTLARLQKSVATHATSERELDDAQSLADSSAADLANARAGLRLVEIGPREEDIAQAKALANQLRADLDLSRRQLADASLYAPADGIIRTRVVEPGQMASPLQSAFTLTLTDPKWVRAYVAEPDLGKVHPGGLAEVNTDSYPGRPYSAWIGSISPQAEFTPKSVQTEELRTALVYEVRVYVHDPNDELRLGMPVTVKLREGAATRPSTQPLTPDETR